MAKVELDIRTKIANLQKGLNKTEKQLKGLQKQSTKTSRTMQANMQKTSGAVTNLTAKIGALLTIGAAVQFTKAIINVRSEFAKFQAVLTNTLGSAQAANREFAKIQDFAKNTPFSVRELTDSFVRLVNQGFKPTTEQMRKLGDLAASTGKEFIMLTEAIIDAQTGEFERLKEFGIRASKQGDQVTFTFKEIETQVEFTASAIQGYILSLGELEGVSGAMEAISKTLGGQINNLADAWDNLLNTLGKRSEGVFGFVIEKLGATLNILDEFNQLQQGITENSREFLAEFVEGIEKLSAEEKIAEATEEMNHYNELFMQMNDNTQLFSQIYSKEEIKQFEALATTYNAIKIGLSNFIEEQKELIANKPDEEEEIETLETLQKKLKGLNEDRKALNITDTEGIILKNQEIMLLKEQIKQLQILGTELVKINKLKIEDATIEKDNITFQDELIAEQAAEQLRIEGNLNQDILDITNQRIDDENAALDEKAEVDRQREFAKVAAIDAGFTILKSVFKDDAEAQQALAISQAIINGALAITKVQAQTGVLSPPFIIATALQTLAQIAVIRSQKFEKGGYDVLKGRRHAQGGVQIGIGEAEEGEGHAVFSRQATQKYGKFLPAFVKAINENEATVTGYGDKAYNIHFDDAKQVNELKAIRELLAKEEITYQGKYKIITRDGHTIKVRL